MAPGDSQASFHPLPGLEEFLSSPKSSSRSTSSYGFAGARGIPIARAPRFPVVEITVNSEQNELR